MIFGFALNKGRGNAGRLMHPQPPTPKIKKTGAVFTDTPEHPALRTQWFTVAS
jgi:hypothetical protein